MQTKRFLLRFIPVALLLLAVMAGVALVGAGSHTHAASPTRNLSLFALEHQVGHAGGNPATSVVVTTCPGASSGNLVLSVTEKVTNDADSGQAGNYWGLDAFTRTITVWNTGSDTYCATVTYDGTFAAQAGQKSPGNTGILTGDEVGTINGGYLAQITGPLDVSDPSHWPLHGKVNGGATVNYQCVINPDGSLQTNPCPGAVDWTTKYFDTASTSFTFNENPWGWKYVGKDKPSAPDHGKSDGTWINASTGNSGDILDVD